MVGKRDTASAAVFVGDMARRLTARIQLTTDGQRMYLDAVEQAFGSAVDYAMLIKLYGGDGGQAGTRYSRGQTLHPRPHRAHHRRPRPTPRLDRLRQNLTRRMNMRRFLLTMYSPDIRRQFLRAMLHSRR